MRSLLPAAFLSLALLSPVFAAPPAVVQGRVEAPEVALEVPPRPAVATTSTSVAAGAAIPTPLTEESLEKKTDGGSPKGTMFNGQQVPPLIEINGEKIDEEISTGFWLVEFFSPYCHHCKAFAPTWQTLYEFYYTSKPVAASQESPDSQSSLNSFSRYYNFKFAKVDCVAFGTACSKKNVHSFPTVVLFKDGKEVKTSVGAKDLASMSKFVEDTLESIRPGSRPKEGVKLPKVGAAGVAVGAKPDVSAEKDKDAAGGKAAGEKHNEVATASTSSEKSTATKKSTKTAEVVPKETANKNGKSIPLTAESFQKLVTTTRDPWFVKFYAPWCHHCQAMAPNWQGMAREMQNRLNVGEVNCDVEKRLCKDVRVKGYPTLLFFQGGERVEYDGLRGLGDLISFTNKAVVVRDGVLDVDAAAFEELEKTEEVIFLYFYDHATTTEDFQALERLVLSLIGHAKLVKTNDPKLAQRFKISTWPRLLVSRDGKPTYYTALAPKDTREFRKVLTWMQSVWLPIVPELTASNSREIMDNKLVVLGILSRDRSDEFAIAKREIKNAALEWIDKQTQAYQLERQELRDAKQLRIEEAEDRNDQRALRAAKSIRINMDEIERKDVGFAWVDGVFWERWVRTTYGISVRDGERVVINDEDNRRYWDTTITGNPIVPSRTSILETLPKIVASPPKIAPKSTTSQLGRFFFQLRGALSSHPLFALAILAGFAVGVVVWVRRQVKSGRALPAWGEKGGFFQLDGREGMGLLGGGGAGGAGGKVD
ncbi:hypothetical protein LTR04_001448 [Oleoguttula sp. CCFEE 6159]|nr:hypothetical protein LTR04_001448 [Oleoguttula sp. CCFEE 6159]